MFFFNDDVVYPIAHVCRGLQPPAMWTNRCNAPETIVGFARLWRIHAWRILEIENWSWINDTSKINQETSLTLGWEWHQSRHPDGIHYVRYLGWLLQGYSTFMMVLSVAFTFLGRAPIEVYWAISRWTVEYFWHIPSSTLLKSDHGIFRTWNIIFDQWPFQGT